MKKDGLDVWIDRNPSKSIITPEQITRRCLKERISELEKTRDEITYELDRLYSLVDGMKI